MDLTTLQPEKSHFCELLLEDQLGTVSLHVSITAQSDCGAPSNLEGYVDDPEVLKDVERSFSLAKTAQAMGEVGWLQVGWNLSSILKYYVSGGGGGGGGGVGGKWK